MPKMKKVLIILATAPIVFACNGQTPKNKHTDTTTTPKTITEKEAIEAFKKQKHRFEIKGYRSNVRWNDREINLDTEDTKMRKDYKQVPVGHEFGHAIGYLYDEYNSTLSINNGFLFDQDSIMNVGMKLRNRHLQYIIYQLSTIYPNTTFQLI